MRWTFFGWRRRRGIDEAEADLQTHRSWHVGDEEGFEFVDLCPSQMTMSPQPSEIEIAAADVDRGCGRRGGPGRRRGVGLGDG